ncbi:MAG: hypothetical protein JW751_11790 [Polyangiaceae bacterium]|nr:hypothetical protein [Polyangiaceae bacterium]
MMSRAKLLLLVATLLGLACSPATPTTIGRVQQRAVTGARDTGLVPYPVHERPTDGSMPTSSWDGTLAELLAADAFALCAAGTQLSQGAASQPDATLVRLEGRMSSALCGEMTEPIPLVQRWHLMRTLHPQCNADPTAGAPATVPPVVRDGANYVINDLGVPVAEPGLADTVRRNANAELDVAEVNLCMAQVLRENLSTADTLFMSAEENLELLALIRERAQLAMLQYALLGRVIAAPEEGTVFTVTHGLMTLPTLKQWGRLLSPAQAREVGADFLTAIRLHVQTTEELAGLLARTPFDGMADGSAEKVWGPGGGRQRLLRLLYGGDVLDFDPNFFGALPMPAIEDARAREVEVLLGLARQADALGFYGEKAHTSGGAWAPWPVLHRAESGDRIFRGTEADLRNRDCLLADPSAACDLAWDDPAVPGTEAYGESLLFQRFQVTPAHAEQLAAMFASAMTQWSDYGRLHIVGEHDHTGDCKSASGCWMKIDPEFTIAQAGPVELTSKLTHAYGLQMPGTLVFGANPREQGFGARWEPATSHANPTVLGFGNMAMRLAGAIPALAAVRHQILRAFPHSGNENAYKYFEDAAAALGLIEAAVGRRTLSVTPATTLNTFTGPGNCGSWAIGNVAPDSCPVLVSTNSVQIEVATESADPVTTVAFGNWHGDEVTAALGASFRSATTGLTRAELLDSLPLFGLTESSIQSRTLRRVGATAASPNTYVLMGRYVTGEGDTVYEPLLPKTARFNSLFFGAAQLAGDARHLGYGGTLRQIAAAAWALNPRDWAQPLYDGFGLPIDWVPPSDPAILGAQAGETAVDYYLRTAREAAAAARDAVQTAVASLLEQAVDQATLDAARTRAQSLDELEMRALCGDGELPCAPRETVVARQSFGGYICPDPTPQCATANNLLAVAAEGLIAAEYDAEIYNSMGSCPPCLSSDPPATFAAYQGGSIYSALVAHWSAVTNVRSNLATAAKAASAQADAVAAAGAVLGASDDALGRLCSDDQYLWAVAAGSTTKGVDVVFHQGMWEVAEYYGEKMGTSGFTCGPLVAAWNACEQAQEALPATEAQAAAVEGAAYYQMATYRQAVAAGMGEVIRTSGELRRLFSQLELVKQKNAVETAAATASTETRAGITRRYQSYDVWRARALLENARRLAVAARRAIEGRYAVDLSLMRAPEAFVDSPANWADEIYVPDLSLPSAVGLSARPEESAGGSIYPNKLEDYVRNLDLFVQGYSVSRPVASAHADAEVLSLDGPETLVESECQPITGTTCDPAGCLHVQHLAAGTASDDTIHPFLRLVNNGSSAIDPDELEVRYWFTKEGSSPLQTWCDWTTPGCSHTTLSVAPVSPAVTGANRVLSVTFHDAPSLPAQGMIELQLRVNKADWSVFAEQDDYSYAASASFATNAHVALYRNGTRIWGTEPEGLPPGNPEGCVVGEMVEHLGPQAGMWSYWCEEPGEWIAHPGLGQFPLEDRLATACSGVQPTQARVMFLLDPWGRVLGDVAEPPFEARFNGRWQRLAVNLVGTGIRDCSEATDPTACYTEAFLRYDLEHTGRVWVANYDAAWWPLAVPTARVEGGKAIAAEEWLDPLTHGWNLPMVVTAGRQELVGRPLGGDYVLTLDIPPDTRFDRLERIQFLLETDYWVRQDL